MIIQFSLHYFRNYCERKARVYLTKNFLNFATKNRGLIAQKSSEKVYVINCVVPEFSRQFFSLPINLFSAFVSLGLEIFSFIFLIRTSDLKKLVPLIIVFLIVNLIWLVFFNLFTRKIRKSEEKKRRDYREEEEVKIRIFLENLNSEKRPVSLSQIHTLLDKNSGKISSSLFLSTLTELPDFIIPGTAVLFLFLYYQFWLDGRGGLL